MTKKRKINYAELLKGGAEAASEPAPTPPVPPRPEPAPLPVPSAPPEPRPVEVPDEQPAPGTAPTPEVRRRAADRAGSPTELASALNERKRFERRKRGESEPADAGGPPQQHDGAEAAAEQHPAVAAEGESAPDPRPSSAAVAALAGDTMEFAVASAVQSLPFRERARARLGRAELLLFRVGHELFATPLTAVEEAVELTEIRVLPEMSASMLGMTELRGRMVPIYSPSRTLGVDLSAAPAAALIVRSGERRMALAVDDVEDVLDVELGGLRDAPGTEDADGVLVGVARRGRELVAIVDGEALVAACLTDRVLETA